MKKTVYYIIIAVIFLLSFRLYSSLYYPLLNSDNAVTILMIHYFKLPQDIYFWGQNRFGSLIPLIGSLVIKLFGISAISSEAIIHYTILLAGFLAFSHFIKSKFYKIVFAIIWFFPPMRLIDVTQFAFGIQYSIIAIVCVLLELNNKEEIRRRLVLHHLILLSIVVLLITVVWVSEITIISVFLILAVQLMFYLRANKLNKQIFSKPELYYSVSGLVLGYLFIQYAKSIPMQKDVYTVLGDYETIRKTFLIFINSILEFLQFKSDEFFTSIYTYLILIIAGILLINVRKIKPVLNDRTLIFFLLDSIFVFTIIILSKWTYMMGVPRRYFTCSYISLSFLMLLILDKAEAKMMFRRNVNYILIIAAIAGGIGTIYNLKYVYPKTLKPKAEITDEFKKLGNIGIISEYWNSYITSCTNPDLIKATPHDRAGYRNIELAEDVFKQKNIYIIKDMWLKEFPDSLNQFNRLLIKDGKEFRIGDCDVCKYKLQRH